jgi:hypothetical protein
MTIILEEDTSIICEEIAMESRVPKLSIHCVLPEALERKKATDRYMSYRKSILNAFTHYK